MSLVNSSFLTVKNALLSILRTHVVKNILLGAILCSALGIVLVLGYLIFSALTSLGLLYFAGTLVLFYVVGYLFSS